MTDHYREAENLLGFARTHTDTGDERDQMLAETFTARAQVHALLALAGGPRDAKPAEPTTVPLRRAADTWGDDIEVQSVERPGIRWRVRGGKRLRINVDGATWLDLTERSVAMVTLVSRKPYRDDPWAPGQDVTARLAAGEQAPEGTILRDCQGDLYRVEADGRGTMGFDHGWWSSDVSAWAWDGGGGDGWCDYAPLTVATPAQITAAGIHTGGQR